MKNGIFMLGSPAAGKSFWVEHNTPSTFRVINPDDVNEKEFSGQIQTLYRAYLKSCDILRGEVIPNGEDFIFDGTASNPANLKRLYKAAEKAGYDLSLVYIDTDLELCLEQNDGRDRRLPPKVIIAVHEQCAKAWKVVSKWKWADIQRVKRQA